jgi:predicted dehydrogenase
MMKKICIVGMGIGNLYKSVTESLGWHAVTVDPDVSKHATYLDISTIPEDEKFDMAIICTPNYLHESVARQLTKYTDRIVVEKPGFATLAHWTNFQTEFPRVKLFMVKNNMYRVTELEYIRESIREYGVESIKILWVNKNRVPGAGSWFTDKKFAYGGVSMDLMPHALSVVQAILREPNLTRDNFIARRYQAYSLKDDVFNSNYGNSNPNGVYNVDDQAYFHTYVSGVSVECITTWKVDNIARDFAEWHIRLKNGFTLKYTAGLCPENAYAAMLDAYMLMTDKKYQSYVEYDRTVHHIINNFITAPVTDLIHKAIDEN